MIFIKKLVTVIFTLLIKIFNFFKKIKPGFLFILRELFINKTISTKDVILPNLDKIKFICNSSLSYFRASTFFSKEPETVQWIKDYINENKKGAFLDIGANIGIYSLYAAKLSNRCIYAFEPLPQNIFNLIQNINSNNLQSNIKIIQNPLTDFTKFGDMKISSLESGASCASFDVDYGWDGHKHNTIINYTNLGFSLDDLYERKVLDTPPYMIKIDVDGIEALILRGAKNTLKNKNLKTILIEVTDYFSSQKKEINDLLKSYGFKIKKRQIFR